MTVATAENIAERDRRSMVLVKRFQSGDQDAFAELCQMYYDPVLNFLRKKSPDNPESEDWAQEAFLKTQIGLRSFTDKGKPVGSWLFKIANNCRIDSVRRRKHTTLPLDEVSEGQFSQTTTNPQILDTVAEQDELVHSLDRITPKQRRVIKLRFVDGLSIEETAHTMGRSTGAVKHTQTRGLAGLRTLLVTGRRVKSV